MILCHHLIEIMTEITEYLKISEVQLVEGFFFFFFLLILNLVKRQFRSGALFQLCFWNCVFLSIECCIPD